MVQWNASQRSIRMKDLSHSSRAAFPTFSEELVVLLCSFSTKKSKPRLESEHGRPWSPIVLNLYRLYDKILITELSTYVKFLLVIIVLVIVGLIVAFLAFYNQSEIVHIYGNTSNKVSSNTLSKVILYIGGLFILFMEPFGDSFNFCSRSCFIADFC